MRPRIAPRLAAAALLGACAALSACAPAATPSATLSPMTSAAGSAATPATPRPLNVLFLGHRSEHHNSAAYAPALAHALVQRGIRLTYEDDPAVALRPERLRHYDALLIYANHDSIRPEQEKALLDFVAAGGGFVPVHSASFCFRNSPAYVALVGAQFASHDTGTFTVTTVAPEHPITKGLETITTWDETYVHSHNSPDRVVLQERVDGARHEPYTWTRTHGKGRVFYTALGHDQRTWGNPGFLHLIERGITWAVSDTARAAWAALRMPAQDYDVARLPNYEKRDPAPRMQRPLSPAESQKLINVPAEFRLELFAAEPQITKPIAMTWDERGRLWIAETVDYPNTVRKGAPGRDRIRILEDTDGDGRADKFTLFADSLNIPTSLVLSRGGVIVSGAPNFLFLKDTTGDDRADVRQIISSGWGTMDTHAGPSNLQYAPDNQIWGAVGYSGYDGAASGTPLKFGQGFYRFHPDGSALERISATSNNTWGLGFSESFDVFGSTANNAPSWYVALADRYMDGVRGLEGSSGSRGIADFYAMHPVTPNIRQVDVHGGYTAAAGHHLYTARAFPREYWNRVALITEPTGHLLSRGIVEPQGAGFVTRDGWTLLAGADEWVSPIAAQVGPDGAVWVIDWYNFIVQHNPTPTGFENGAGNAYETELRDRRHGRIYRVVHRDAGAPSIRSLDKNDAVALVAALRSDNLFWRLTAQRLLVERGQRDVVPALVALTRDTTVDAIGIAGASFHALWTLHGLGALDGSDASATGAAISALRHPAAGVRKAAAQVLPRGEAASGALLDAGLLRDRDLHTRLAALLALSEMPASDAAGRALYPLSREPEFFKDRWLSRAVYVAAARHSAGFLAAHRADPAALPVSALPEAMRGASRVGPVGWERSTPKDIAAWPTMPLPGRWEDGPLKDLDGIVWLVREVQGTAAGAAKLQLAAIDDMDETWVNGVRVGTTDGYDKPRAYTVPAIVWKKGSNVVAVRVTDGGGGGGLWGSPDSLRVTEAGGHVIPLGGPWHYRVEKDASSAGLAFSQPGELATYFAQNYGAPAASPATVARGAARAVAVTVLQLKVMPQRLAFDRTVLTARAGAEVEIVLENPDQMQHNVVVGKPGSYDRLGAAADALARSPNGSERGYVPATADVIAATRLADPGETVRVRFTAPSAPGEYPFVCTFPGHWRVMRGVLRVRAR